RKIVVAPPQDGRAAQALARKWVLNVKRDLRTMVPGRPLAGGVYLLKEALVAVDLRYRNQPWPVPVDAQSLTKALNS
ncbi:MAG: hypothetical protein WBA43_25375, partial [Elainellaceae cyanobacterium]